MNTAVIGGLPRRVPTERQIFTASPSVSAPPARLTAAACGAVAKLALVSALEHPQA
jgi:hypothetical protein